MNGQPEPRSTKTYLDPHEVAALEEQALSVRDKLLIRILFRTGSRITEALALSVDDVDFQRQTITIHHLKTRMVRNCHDCGTRLARAHTFCPGCGTAVEEPVEKQREHRKVRNIPLDRLTLELLRDYIDRGGPVTRRRRRLIFGISRSRAWQVVRQCAEKAGLDKLVNPTNAKMHHVSPHRLRDAFAVMAVRRDDSTDGIRMLQEQLGHASIATTMRYRKVAGKELREWYDNLWEGESNGDSAPTSA